MENNKKTEFIEKMKSSTKKLAVDTIKFCDSLNTCKASAVITYQLVKSATSTGANYRAACMARSQGEFFSKICIVSEEVDETEYWFEVILEAELTKDIKELERLKSEANEISKIVSKAKKATYISKSNRPIN